MVRPSGQASYPSSLRPAKQPIKLKSSQSAAGAVDLNRLFLQLRKDPLAHARSFWEVFKAKLLQKEQTVEEAFRAYSCSQDQLMSLVQFQELCEYLGLTLYPNTLRVLFETRLREKEVAWSKQDFQDTLVTCTIDQIKNRLQAYNRSSVQTADHIDRLLRYLTLQTGEENQHRAVARFQHKISLRFCMDLWEGMKKWTLRSLQRNPGAPSEIDCENFLKIVQTTSLLQVYELDFLSNIFDRVDRSRQGRVNMVDLVVALMLFSVVSNRSEKAQFLFCIFDPDNDGCLTSEQILRMYCSAAIHSAIAKGDQTSYDADVLLGEELALAQARRLYDYTLMELARNASDGSDLCTFQEWWAVLEANPMLLDALVPGVHRILWVLRPVGQPQTQQKKQPSSKNSRGSIMRAPGALVKKATLETAVKRPKAGIAICNGAPASDQKPDSKNSTERFRVHAAIRFRHAVRGEWDAVDALQNQYAQSAEHTTAVKLPSVGGVAGRNGAANRVACLSTEKAHANDPWADGIQSFGRRQRERNWHDGHRETLADWSKAGFCPSPSMGQSQSLPDLRALPRRHVLMSSSPPMTPSGPIVSNAQLQEAQARSISRIASEARLALDRMPSTTQRFGERAVHRIRNYSEVRASMNVAVNEACADRVCYDCQLCGGRHDVCVPCLG